MITDFVPQIVLGVGIWMVVNGILHDTFVLVQHKGPYSRDLLRLLMDGHVLITCGLIQVLVYPGLQQSIPWAAGLATLASSSLLVYCLMIFPFLKSLLTMALNISCIGLLLFHVFA
jgi:hypothetical protein